MADREVRIIKIGGSHFVIVPSEFMKVYDLNDYIYYVEVSRDGKTITYKRMRKNEPIQSETEGNKKDNKLSQNKL